MVNDCSPIIRGAEHHVASMLSSPGIPSGHKSNVISPNKETLWNLQTVSNPILNNLESPFVGWNAVSLIDLYDFQIVLVLILEPCDIFSKMSLNFRPDHLLESGHAAP